jgi:thiol-disulfide isomerase/thioredoxin
MNPGKNLKLGIIWPQKNTENAQNTSGSKGSRPKHFLCFSVWFCGGSSIGTLALVAVLVAVVLYAVKTKAQESEVIKSMGAVNAPDFPKGMEWLNTDHPISLKELRGKVVILDFWTFCCINCMHVLPQLKRLEQKYRNELVVIGIHSAKFTTEKETENIRQAILRYEIEHPVVNDRDMTVWRNYGVMAWPTVFLIDPAGKVIGYASGERIYDAFDKLIAQVISEFDKKGLVNHMPIKFNLERNHVPASILSFPGKVLADEASKRLFIADSNHNRVVVASLDGTILDVIGSAEAGFKDGRFEEAAFNHPQGMALDGENLYVADTENHAIRRADLKAQTVSTIAGTGKQAASSDLSGPGTKTPLNSPWDLVLLKDRLYIAMAGAHQLWRLNLKTDEIGPYAGSGREGRRDGDLRQAWLAQPSGITSDGKKLYFADSESSSIRSADLDFSGRVETIVGLDLFEFGDRDGVGSEARLQHPLGVVYHGGGLYVADTYNNKIKQVFPGAKNVVTFLGTGEAGLRDGDSPLFDEPGGLSAADGKLYVADTNNHVIRVADLKTKGVSTIEFRGIEQLRARMPKGSLAEERVKLEPQVVAPGAGRLLVSLQLPEGYELNAQAPSYVELSAEGKAVALENGRPEQTIRNPRFPLAVPLKVTEGEGLIRATMVLYYCQHGKEGRCLFKEVRIEAPVRVVAPRAGEPAVIGSEVKLNYELRAGGA